MCDCHANIWQSGCRRAVQSQELRVCVDAVSSAWWRPRLRNNVFGWFGLAASAWNQSIPNLSSGDDFEKIVFFLVQCKSECLQQVQSHALSITTADVLKPWRDHVLICSSEDGSAPTHTRVWFITANYWPGMCTTAHRWAQRWFSMCACLNSLTTISDNVNGASNARAITSEQAQGRLSCFSSFRWATVACQWSLLYRTNSKEELIEPLDCKNQEGLYWQTAFPHPLART